MALSFCVGMRSMMANAYVCGALSATRHGRGARTPTHVDNSLDRAQPLSNRRPEEWEQHDDPVLADDLDA
jgi:hypothetical protein